MTRWCLAVLLVSASAAAQPARGRLPLDAFTVAEGLPNDSITQIVTDSRGYVWFATLDGLSRYDGQRFVNYSTDDGLPDRMIWSIAEDRERGVWVGSGSGVARMATSATRGRGLFTRFAMPNAPPVESQAIVGTRDGAVWTACHFVGERGDVHGDLCIARDGALRIDESFRRAGGEGVYALVASPAGDLWVGTQTGLLRRRADGTWLRYAVQPHRDADIIHGLLLDPGGRLWIATGFGVIVFAPDDGVDARPLAERAGPPLASGMPMRLPRRGQAVAISVPNAPLMPCGVPFRASDGAIWVPSYIGLLRIADGKIDFFDSKDGLPALEITAVGEDPAGDLWIGTRGAGALRLAHSGARSYTRAHGLANERIMSLLQLDDRTICATNRKGMSCFGGGQIHHASLWPRNSRFPGWGWNQIVVHDRGSWWFATGEGLVRWPAVRHIEDLGRIDPLAVYTRRDGLDSDDIFRVWQDSRGNLWVGTFGRKPLSRGDPVSGRFVSFGPAEGFGSAAPTAFAEDRAGNIWFGVYVGGLLRLGRDGRFERITRGVPPGLVRDLKIDSQGALWIATVGGVARIDNPTAAAAQMMVRHFGRAQGLAADSGYCIAELRDGRMAIGSQRGVDIVDRELAHVVHLSTRDGLASSEVSVAMTDASGALWLGTVNGLSRLERIPEPRPAAPPQPRIQSIQIDGVPAAVAELGAIAIPDVRVEWPHHGMAIAFGAPYYDPAHPLRFEYRVAQSAPWTDAGSQRAIVFDRLASGAGAIEVRAVTASGAASAPARVSFVVIPPVWKRTWFIALAIALAAALALAVHRARVAHLVALERVRTRVATDLHDDLGSTLSRISILSEAAKRKSADAAPILDEIANSARGLVDALGDSIWSIDPHRDDVRSIVLRAHHFAAALFEAQSVAVSVALPPDVAALRLGHQQRRETYLILKEALNNAAKHAAARRVEIIADADARSLRIGVKDDGKGCAAASGNGGRGVPSMMERARRAGGRLEIASEPDRGTSIIVSLPL